MAVVSLATAQRLFGLPGQVNSLQILLHHGADAAAVQALLAPRLPPGVLIQSPGARAELAGATLAAARRGLEGLGGAAMLGAIFVVYNSFRLGTGERRPALAALRALGATRWQVVRLLLTEAQALAAAGTVLGAMSGPLLAAVLVRALGGLDVAPAAAHGYGALAFAALIGPAAAVAAAFQPAWSSGKLDLLEELRTPRGGDETAPRFLPALGLGLVTAASGFWLCAGRGVVPAATARALFAPAVGAFLAGGMLAAPPLLDPLLGLAGRLLAPIFGVEFVIAARQLLAAEGEPA